MIPFKVVCVKKGKWGGPLSAPDYFAKPKYGDICTVVHIDKSVDGNYYELAEYPPYWGRKRFFNTQRFQTLSDTTIEQVIENLKEVPEPINI